MTNRKLLYSWIKILSYKLNYSICFRVLVSYICLVLYSNAVPMPLANGFTNWWRSDTCQWFIPDDVWFRRPLSRNSSQQQLLQSLQYWSMRKVTGIRFQLDFLCWHVSGYLKIKTIDIHKLWQFSKTAMMGPWKNASYKRGLRNGPLFGHKKI